MGHAGRGYVKIVAATSSRGTSEASGNDDLEDVKVIPRQFRNEFPVQFKGCRSDTDQKGNWCKPKMTEMRVCFRS